MERIQIQIRGKVQGVFFRTGAKEKADALGLGGWVRNEEDGSVLIIAEGGKNALLDFIAWCGKAEPSFAEIENIKVEWEKAEGNVTDFSIRYI